MRKAGFHGNRRLRKAGGARGKQKLSAFGEQVLANAGSCGQQRRAWSTCFQKAGALGKQVFAESRYVRKAGVCRKDVHSEGRDWQKAGACGLVVAGDCAKTKIKKCLLKRGVCAKQVFTETGACGKQEQPAESRSSPRKAGAFGFWRAGSCGQQQLVQSTSSRKAGICLKQALAESRWLR